MDSCVTRADIEQYVYDILPWDETQDWDIPGIADAMTRQWPDLIGHHPDIPLDAINQPWQWIDHHIDVDLYWRMVAENQK